MRSIICLVVASLLPAGPAAAPLPSQSVGPVTDLSTWLSSHNQMAIAAKDPGTGEFVAALFYPGVQLLVVSGRPPAPDAVDAQLAAGNFQDVYAALQDAAARPGRLFVQDMGADGLKDGGESVDVAYDEGRQTLFDGNPRAHKISEKAYRETFTKTDGRYAHMVGLLLERSKQLVEKR